MDGYQHYAAPQCVAKQVDQAEVDIRRVLDSGARPVDVAGVTALATTICYLSVVILLGRLLRSVAECACPVRLRPYLLDLVTAFQLLACSLEYGHIRAFAGGVGFAIALVFIPFWAGFTITQGSDNPCCYLMMYTQGMMGMQDVLTRIACQVTGGLLSYQYARLFWSLELADGHVQRLTSTHCMSDLKVPLVAGFAIEFIGTISLTLLAKATFTRQLPVMPFARCIAGAAVVLAGVEFTGMYLNPINATNQTFGCHGTDKLEHLIVYWGAPFAATICAGVTQRHLYDIWKTMTVEDRSTSNDICHNDSHHSGILNSIPEAVVNKNGVGRKRSKSGNGDQQNNHTNG